MAVKTLQDALVEEMEDLLSAEQQIVAALPKMMEKATSPDLKAAFDEHLTQTKNQVSRLEQAFKSLGEEAKAKTCEATKGLVKEASEMMQEDIDPQVMDAMLIGAAQKIEHYEIASYGTACTWAAQLGLDDVHDLLGETLDEEEETDEKLSMLAEGEINEEAV